MPDMLSINEEPIVDPIPTTIAKRRAYSMVSTPLYFHAFLLFPYAFSYPRYNFYHGL